MTRHPVPRTDRSGIVLIAWSVGVLMGAVLFLAVGYDADGGIGTESALIPAVAPQPTDPPQTVVIAVPTFSISVDVRPRWTLPTATATPMPTIPPVTPPPTPEDWCGDPALGQECRMRPAPTATRVPLPDCPASPGTRCVWRSAEATGPEMEVGE